MDVYEWEGQKFRAWSKMKCNKARGNKNTNPPTEKEDHNPHSWSSEFTIYGPYFCEGLNPTPPYKPKHRKEEVQ